MVKSHMTFKISELLDISVDELQFLIHRTSEMKFRFVTGDAKISLDFKG
jgi:hypothetical protein